MTQNEWDFLRNEQRNWDTLVQLAGLRFQPSQITSPQKSIGQWQYNNELLSDIFIWKCDISYDTNAELLVQQLNDDFNNIPIVTSLQESVTFPTSCFITIGSYTNFDIKLKI